MVEFAVASISDLVLATQFLHHVNPKLIDKIVYGIEKNQPGDQSLVFHLVEREKIGTPNQTSDMQIYILSADFISNHSYWKGGNT